jgi:hypothetical protein
LPLIGCTLSGTYHKIDEASLVSRINDDKVTPFLIQSPEDKATEVKDATTKGHSEFTVE